MYKSHNSKITVSAKNLDLAIIKAAGELISSPSDIEYSVEKQSSGFLGLCKKVTINAWNKKLNLKSSPSIQAKSNKRPKKSYKENISKRSLCSISKDSSKDNKSMDNSFDLDQSLKIKDLSCLSSQQLTIVDDLKKFLSNILKQGFVIDEHIQCKIVESGIRKRLVFDVNSQKLADLLQENDKLAESLEHILRKKPKHLKKQLTYLIFVDACSFRINREHELYKLAKQTSDQVHNSSKSMSLDCFKAHDRKIIHLFLGKDPRVVTKSIGKGAKRKLLILPNHQNRSV